MSGGSAIFNLHLAVTQAAAAHPEWRPGQAAFTALWERHRWLAKKIQGSDLDPFHDDTRLPAFWEFVTQRLGKVC